MQFTDLCLISENVAGLVKFYEKLFGTEAEGDAIHSFLELPSLGLAVYSKTAAIDDMGFDFTEAGTGLYTIGFDCEDAQKEYERIAALGICEPTEPQIWPWGAKSFRFADPDGHVIIIRSRPQEN